MVCGLTVSHLCRQTDMHHPPIHKGFIERADIPQQIYFHLSTWTGEGEPVVGMEVAFDESDRKGKPLATNVSSIPKSLVKIYDIDTVSWKRLM